MFRYELMQMMLENSYTFDNDGEMEFCLGKGKMITELLSYHRQYETDQRIKKLVFDLEKGFRESNQEFAEKYLRIAQEYVQTRLKAEKIFRFDNGLKTNKVALFKRGGTWTTDGGLIMNE